MKKQYKLKPPFSWIVELLRNLTATILAGEGVVVEFLVVVGSWITPLTPAYMTYKHMIDNLGFAQEFAIITAASIEILGLASGHTVARLYQHNKANRAKKSQVSIMPVWVTFFTYLAVILIVNVVLDWGQIPTVHLVAQTALVFLTIPAIVIVSARSQMRDIIEGVSYAVQDVPNTQGTTTNRSGTRSEQKRNKKKRSGTSGTEIVYKYLSKLNETERFEKVADVPTARELQNILSQYEIAPSSAHNARKKFIRTERLQQ